MTRTDSDGYTPELGTEKGVIVPTYLIFFDKEDEFEEMQITDYGQVFIWTKKRV